MSMFTVLTVLFASFLAGSSASLCIESDEICIITSIETQLESLKNKLRSNKIGNGTKTEQGFGSTYVRWGRPDCPKHSELIYDGYMAGKKHSKNGGGANYLCMTKTPEYTHLQSPNIAENLYGVETDINGFYPDIVNNDATCAVCYTPKRSSVLMIPGKKSCPPKWTTEYWGYLMSGGDQSETQPTEYVCTDKSPVGVPGGGADNGHGVVYLVGGMCGSLKCPPYINRKPITCVVCSK